MSRGNGRGERSSRFEVEAEGGDTHNHYYPGGGGGSSYGDGDSGDCPGISGGRRASRGDRYATVNESGFNATMLGGVVFFVILSIGMNTSEQVGGMIKLHAGWIVASIVGAIVSYKIIR